MSTSQVSDLPVPEWVQRLNNPSKQIAKAKSSGIPDPPGYISSNKVRFNQTPEGQQRSDLFERNQVAPRTLNL